jgi:hypothetical protein
MHSPSCDRDSARLRSPGALVMPTHTATWPVNPALRRRGQEQLSVSNSETWGICGGCGGGGERGGASQRGGVGAHYGHEVHAQRHVVGWHRVPGHQVEDDAAVERRGRPAGQGGGAWGQWLERASQAGGTGPEAQLESQQRRHVDPAPGQRPGSAVAVLLVPPKLAPVHPGGQAGDKVDPRQAEGPRTLHPDRRAHSRAAPPSCRPRATCVTVSSTLRPGAGRGRVAVLSPSSECYAAPPSSFKRRPPVAPATRQAATGHMWFNNSLCVQGARSGAVWVGRARGVGYAGDTWRAAGRETSPRALGAVLTQHAHAPARPASRRLTRSRA